MINGFVNLSTAGMIHTVLSSVGILVGAEQVLRQRRDRLHRYFGYVYVVSMLVADIAILTVYRFNGHFNMFHVGALANMLCTGMALQPMLSSPRPEQWRLKHYIWICWSYVGLLAAALTEFIVRTQPMGSRAASLVATVLATSFVALVGAFLIRKNQPARAPARVAPAGTTERRG